MRVLFISPLTEYQDTPRPCWLPLGPAFIASGLRKEGHAVSIFDRHASQVRIGVDKDRINRAMLAHIRRFKPDLIGLQTVSPLIYDTVECARLIREIYQGLMVAGGHHATALPEICLKKIPELDGVVAGEGERAVAKLAAGEPRAAIPGLWWRGEDGDITGCPPEQISDLDRLPFPALDLLDMDYYTRPGLHAIRGYYLSTASLITSRGCTRRCEFCAESLTYGKGVRFHSPGYVIEWIREVIADYQIGGIYFHDNDFLIDGKRAREICEKIIASGLHKKLRWAIQARADRIDRSMLKLLKRAGCVLVEIGVESHLQSQLNGVNKGIDVGKIEEAVALCRGEGIAVLAYMITGFENETIADLEDKLRWLKRVGPDVATWNDLRIHPGTALYNRAGGRFFEENDWDEQSVKGYYGADRLSLISPEERKRWLETRLGPYRVRRGRVHIIKANFPFRLASYIYSERKNYLKRLNLFLRKRIKSIEGALLRAR